MVVRTAARLTFSLVSTPLLDILPQSTEGAACLGDSVVDHGIKFGVAGECASQVDEGLYRLKCLSVRRYLRLVVLVSGSWLKHHFRSFWC